MNRAIQLLLLAVLLSGALHAQEESIDFPALRGPYLGQKPPGLKPELFASDIVSVKEGVHGNIVFSPDFSEAAWSPNYWVDDKNVLLRMQYSDGQWGSPVAFYPRGQGFSHGEPFYSYDGNRLYFLSGQINAMDKTEKETIWYVEKTSEGWSEPELLTPVLDSFQMHWQFSLDREGNLYFGGKSGSDKSAEIYSVKCENGKYQTPVKLSENINTSTAEFSPFISPDDDYLIFTRLVRHEGAPPEMNLFISLRDKNGNWQEARNLTEYIELPEQESSIMMLQSQVRVTPDGQYLFFTFFDGRGHMVYWVDAKIIKELKPEESK
jgi:hypothetical protein